MSKEEVSMEHSPSSVDPEKVSLMEKGDEKTKVGLFDAICFIYGNIIGTGVFISVSETFNVFQSTSMAMVLIFWFVGSIITLIGAFCYAELGIRYPSSGGECVYFEEGLHKKFSVLFVIMFAFVVKTITLAAMAVTASKYFVEAIIPNNKNIAVIIKIVAVVLLFICYLMNCISKVVAAKASVVLTVVKTVALSIIIGFGIYYLVKGPKDVWEKPFVLEGFNPLNLAICFINIFWSFEGWNTLGLIAGDMDKPQRNLPLSIGIGVSSVAIMYLLTIVSYSVVLGFNVVRNAETVALIYSMKTLGKIYPLIPILICFSAVGAMNGNFFSTGSVVMSASYKKMLPKIFSLVTKRSRTPVFALTVIFISSLVFIPFDFQVLLRYCAFVTWVFYFLSFTCLWVFKIRDRKKNDKGPKFSINYVFILLLQAVCIFVIVMSFYLSIIGCSVIGGLMIVIFFSQYIPLKISDGNASCKCYQSTIDKLKKWFRLEEATKDDIGGKT